MNILVTGGTGYIGTHTLIELFKHGHTAVVIDNLTNSSKEALRRVEEIASVSIPFHQFDVRDSKKLDALFADTTFDAVIHFAALKAVGESVANPLAYYANNIDSTLVLLDVMQKHGVKKFVFSSSAVVYGNPEELPLRETSNTGAHLTNPYGQTKYMIEQILRDVCVADPTLQISILRYFNPIGAHESGQIGEDPNGTPNNLLPYISQVAVGRFEKVRVFGNDYNTVDGTGVRDYIHVVDLARGHVAAIDNLQSGANVYNLATGTGTSVLQLITAFEKASGKTIPYEIVARRPGDIAACYASPQKANDELGWHTEKTIDDACTDSWHWQSQNPNGYEQ
jgi:UDP-glucose 4-epimerase